MIFDVKRERVKYVPYIHSQPQPQWPTDNYDSPFPTLSIFKEVDHKKFDTELNQENKFEIASEDGFVSEDTKRAKPLLNLVRTYDCYVTKKEKRCIVEVRYGQLLFYIWIG